MRHITSEKAKLIDRRAQKRFHIPSLILMENAGLEVAKYAKKSLKKKNGKIIFICGRGNNAGDGFVAARHLVNEGYKNIKIIIVKDGGTFSQDAELNFKILSKLTNNIWVINKKLNLHKIKKELKSSKLVIDALFGIGLKGAIKGNFKAIIELINKCHRKVLAVDVPSGLNADTGEIQGVCIKAFSTVTFGLPKIGFFKNKGKQICGKIIICPIAFPRSLLR